jgi:signal transduction histidine kinase
MDDLEALLSEYDLPTSKAVEVEKPKILVIDDDESIRRGMHRALAHKYDVLAAESGNQGVEVLSKDVCSVILDVKMKELNGFSTYPKLKSKCPDVPIIFYTAFQSEHDLVEVINKYKPEGYVEKGRDLSFLENLIENSVKKYRLVLENEEYKRDLQRSYEELRLLDKAKERIINHLSHEMRTPLAIISGVLGRITRKLEKGRILGFENTLERGHRNVNRLLDLQAKIDDILDQRVFQERAAILHIVQDALSLVEEISEDARDQYGQELLQAIHKRLDSLVTFHETSIEKIPLGEFLNHLCDEAVSNMGGRDLEIIKDFQSQIVLLMDRKVLFKVCGGLLRNAVENTPDGGRIEIKCGLRDHEICIDFRDFGVGITSENQKMIFGGFFHTQDTNHYASKKPYEFNAGGSGSDLLRTKIFSDRFCFNLDVESTRCRVIPTDTDLCPGRVSICRSVSQKGDCLASGGSIFTLGFPIQRFM